MLIVEGWLRRERLAFDRDVAVFLRVISGVGVA